MDKNQNSNENGKVHENNGNHYGQQKDHNNNGNHGNGNNGNHYGSGTRPGASSAEHLDYEI